MKRVLWVVAIAILTCALVGPPIAHQFNVADNMATHSAAESLWRELTNSDVSALESDDWRLFTDDEYDRTIKQLTDLGASFDACPSCHTDTGTLGDAWGKRFQIAARRASDHNEFIVWSVGHDGVAATNDDVVFPENESGVVRRLLKVGPPASSTEEK